MDQRALKKALAALPLGRVQYFEAVSSTNDVIARWSDDDVPDLSLAAADEQTHGRGRSGRTWFTPPGSALAFSLLLHPPPNQSSSTLTRFTGLGAVAVAEALSDYHALDVRIKWPNDVLLDGKKVCGVLAESHWLGERLHALILGIGINIAPPSVPPPEQVNFPATCVETAVGAPVNRWELLRTVLERLITWRSYLDSADFIARWDKLLAYKGDWVRVTSAGGEPVEGRVRGLDRVGRLKLELSHGEITALQAGEIQLRPLVDR